MKVVVLKYNAGNIHSVRLALNRLGITPHVTDDPLEIQAADAVIFPGVGEASSAMEYLTARGLDDVFRKVTSPVLGICLGLQLMCRHSEENNTPCLDVFNAAVKKFPPRGKVPHMGWNTIGDLKGELFTGVAAESYVYFVHSYYAEYSDAAIAKSEYMLPFSAGLQKDNFFAVQFHPEKSGTTGEQILKNFLAL